MFSEEEFLNKAIELGVATEGDDVSIGDDCLVAKVQYKNVFIADAWEDGLVLVDTNNLSEDERFDMYKANVGDSVVIYCNDKIEGVGASGSFALYTSVESFLEILKDAEEAWQQRVNED